MEKFELKLNNFNGIELNENPFHEQTLMNLKRFSYFHLNNSTMQFFYRKKHFDYICDLVLTDTSLNPVFSSFSYLFLGNSKANFYPEQICPAVFKNSRINWLHLANITPSNRLRFQPIESEIGKQLNSKVAYFQIQASTIECLDYSLLDPYVFKYVERFSIEFSNLSAIQTGLFRSFRQLKRIHLWLYNFPDFIKGKFNFTFLIELYLS